MSITRTQTQSKQAGMVAIMVTLVLMIGLIVLGFAQVSRRNQRQALDRQLSTQAFYAAESGVNDAAKIIKTAVDSSSTVAAKPDCASTGGGAYASLVADLDNANKVRYTCLTVDPAPTSLVYSNIGTTSTIVPLVASSGAIASVTLNWQSKADTSTPTTGCPTAKANVFSNTSSWGCGYGVLRFDLVPTAGSLTASSLLAGTMTTFVVPMRSGTADAGSFAYAAGNSNSLRGLLCNDTQCSLTITGLTQSEYYMRISSLYKDVSLQATAADGAGAAVSLTRAQAVIDATGKAQDVLRRMQVRVPLSGSSANRMSDYAIQSTDAICKRYAVMDGYFRSDANAALAAVGVSNLASGNSGNPLCQ